MDELLSGELIQVPSESRVNMEIADVLFAMLLPLVKHQRIRGHGLELAVRGEPSNRRQKICWDLTY